jgi:MSHA biogenesis protein MshP
MSNSRVGNKKTRNRPLAPLHRPPHSQHGISLILVLFLIVVVALLVVAMARLNIGSQKIIGQEVLSVRALFAAESGAQEAAMRIFSIGAAPVGCTPINRAFTAAGLSDCSVSLVCSPPVNAAGRTIITINSRGTCGAGSEIASRNITVMLRTL